MLVDLGFGVLFVLGTAAISVAAYLFAQRITGAGKREQHKEMAGAMITRIGALHGLILALVFAQEMSAYQRLEAQAAVEASAIADVYNDAERYDPQALDPLRQNLAEYLRIVLDAEWASLGRGEGLEDGAWAAWERAYELVLDLEPATARESSLRDHMLDRLHDIATSRDMRANESGTSLANLFWFAALSGVILIAVGYYIYPADRHTLVLLALFSGYTGGILFLIYGFSNPFSPPAALPPTPLLHLAQAIAVAT
jgi:hypothetical protein